LRLPVNCAEVHGDDACRASASTRRDNCGSICSTFRQRRRLDHRRHPPQAYARTWASQTPHIASGIAAGPTVIAASDNTTSPLEVHGPGSNLADSTLLELTANGELILAGGSGNGYRFAELP
jgi:hypothetical protein